MDYRGYHLSEVPDGVAIRFNGELIDYAGDVNSARKLIDDWMDAR